MWIIYEDETLAIAGFTGHGPVELPREDAIARVARGSKALEGKALNAIAIEDATEAAGVFQAFAERRLTLEKTRDGARPVVQPRRTFHLEVTCDAADVHPVDGIPEIKADGESFTTMTVEKVDERGLPLHGKRDNDELYLRTDHGSLHDASGKKEISQIKLASGKATFRLLSEKARRVATVQIFNADRALQDATIQIEFV